VRPLLVSESMAMICAVNASGMLLVIEFDVALQ
jgi:hypothetical protein